MILYFNYIEVLKDEKVKWVNDGGGGPDWEEVMVRMRKSMNKGERRGQRRIHFVTSHF